MAYGPQSQGATAADQNQIYGATLGGQKLRLQQGDIAVSPNLLSQFPIGSYANVVDPSTGQVLRSGVRVADTSWITSGKPTTNSFELYNDQDLGHASLVPASDPGPSSTAPSSSDSAGPSYLGDTTGSPASSIPASQWGSPLLAQIAQLQAANALRGQAGGQGIIQPQGNQVVSALNNAIKQAQIIQQLHGGAGASSGLTGGLSDFLGSGAYRAGLTQADPFGAGGAFDVAAA